MTSLLEKAIAVAKQAPNEQQDLVAQAVFETLDAEKEWEAQFANPQSEDMLERLAQETRKEIQEGNVFNFDPSNPPSNQTK